MSSSEGNCRAPADDESIWLGQGRAATGVVHM